MKPLRHLNPDRRNLLEDHAPQDFCVGCPFGGPRVGSKGNPQAPLVFVAESPGVEEVKKGEPLVGPSGQIFHTHVPDDDSVYILNALECRPLTGMKNDTRMNEAVGCCRNHMLDKISLYPRRLIVAMGNYAVRSLTGDMHHKITQIRGRLMPSPYAELGILPVVHTAALMRGTGSYRQWVDDVEYALHLGAGGSPKEHLKAVVDVIPYDISQEEVDELFSSMGTELTGDIETAGFDHLNDRILSIGITPSTALGVSYCFYPHHLPLIQKYLESPSIKWCWHNGKFDIKYLRHLGIQARVDDDTMLMSYTLDESGGIHGLETVSADVLGAPDYKYMIQPFLPNKKASYELIPPPVLAAYQAIDTSNTAQLRPILRKRVRKDKDLEKLYTRTLLPASEMLSHVEDNGICTDPQRLLDNEDYFQQMKKDIGKQINEMVGYTINAGSPKQVSDLLFNRMRLPNRAKGSTNEKVLKKLQEQTEHPIFGLILKHRKAVKMYGTYVKGISKHVHQDTNRVHATFLLHGTRTGRLAARDPNLQNPPRDPQIRGTFVAAEGFELLEIDLSQAELRSLAALSEDPDLVAVYTEGRDLHTDLANYLYPGYEKRANSGDFEEKTLAKEQRVKTKAVNFGIIYGITPFGLVDSIGGDLQEARDMLFGWAEKYSVAWAFIQACRSAPLKKQVITTCFGRKKRVGIVSRGNLAFLQNEAANFPHQSIASDITLHSAIKLEPILRERYNTRIVNLIHDSILMEVPTTMGSTIRNEVIELVSSTMESVPKEWGITAVPFLTDAEVGYRWGSLKEPKEVT